MKKIKLLLLSSIFTVYGTYDAMSGAIVAPRQIQTNKEPLKQDFTQEQLQEDIDLSEPVSDAQQKDDELKAKIAEKEEQLKTFRKESTEQIKALMAEIEEATKEKKLASATLGTEGAERLKRKILNHSEAIKLVDEKIKQAIADHTAEIKRINDEKAAQIKEENYNHAIIIKDLNDQKALSAAKKKARENELAALKQQRQQMGAKIENVPAQLPAPALAQKKK